MHRGPNGHVYIVSAARTPIGKFGGALANIPAVQLGAVAIAAAVERGLPPDVAIDEVLMGQVLQAGVGQAPARKAALLAGLPDTTSATTINRVCGSGLKSIMLAAAEIRAGDAEVAVAGGMESMNLAPYLLPKARFGYRLGNGDLLDADDPGRPVVHDRGVPHGHPRRARRDQVRGQPRRSGRVGPDEPPARDRGDGRRPVRRRDGAGDHHDSKGRETIVDTDEGPGATPAPRRSHA